MSSSNKMWSEHLKEQKFEIFVPFLCLLANNVMCQKKKNAALCNQTFKIWNVTHVKRKMIYKNNKLSHKIIIVNKSEKLFK